MASQKNHKRNGRTAVVAAVVTAAVPVAGQAAAGRVQFAIGNAIGVDKNGNERRLSRGGVVESGDTIRTGRRSRVQIRFADNSFTSIKPNTEFRVDEFEFEETKQEESRSFFSLLKGGLRTVTGLIGKARKKAWRMSTPVATIGIRGTGGSIDHDPQENETQIQGDAGTFDLCNLSDECADVGPDSTGVVDANGNVEVSRPNGGGNGGGGNNGLNLNGYSSGEDTEDDGTNVGLNIENTPEAEEEPILPVEEPSIPMVVVEPDPSVEEPSIPVVVVEPDPPVEEPRFEDGAFYVLSAVYDTDSVEGNFVEQFLDTEDDGSFVEIRFDPDSNQINQFTGTSGIIPSNVAMLDTAIVREFTNADNVLGWARWTEGSIQASGRDYPEPRPDYTAQEGHHIVFGLPAPELPISGTASFDLIGGTRPTIEGGVSGVGTLNSGSLEANFAASTVDVQLGITMPGLGDLNVDTASAGDPLVIDPLAIFSVGFSGSGAVTTGGGCGASGPCFTSIQGFFAGVDEVTHAGLTYKISSEAAGFRYILGTAGFEIAP